MNHSFRRTLTTFTLFSAVAFAGMAVASPKCTDESQDKWQNAETFQENLKKQGYKIKRFQITDGNCYEIYGWDEAGKKVEIYYNPVDGSVVKSNIEK